MPSTREMLLIGVTATALTTGAVTALQPPRDFDDAKRQQQQQLLDQASDAQEQQNQRHRDAGAAHQEAEEARRRTPGIHEPPKAPRLRIIP